MFRRVIGVLFITAFSAATTFSAGAPLVDAVKARDKATVLKLLQQKVNVNTPEVDGTTALHWAVEQDDTDKHEDATKEGVEEKFPG